jgi:hypothetical protein
MSTVSDEISALQSKHHKALMTLMEKHQDELERLIHTQRMEMEFVKNRLNREVPKQNQSFQSSSPHASTSKLSVNATVASVKKNIETGPIPLPPLPKLSENPRKECSVTGTVSKIPRTIYKDQKELSILQTKQHVIQESTLKALKKKTNQVKMNRVKPYNLNAVNQHTKAVELIESCAAKKLPSHLKFSFFNRAKKTLPFDDDLNKENQPFQPCHSIETKCTTMNELFGNDLDLSQSD